MTDKTYTHDEEDLIPLSALQHLLFCERQCALIHVEQQWVENKFTAEGRIMHSRAHSDASESRGDIRIAHGLLLRSLSLGVVGKADVVEFHLTEKENVTILDPVKADAQKGTGEKYWVPLPVEYKRGRPKKDSSDKVQLCAQAVCLEEMTGIEVPEGALFYGKNRRRHNVCFDTALRSETTDAAQRLHALITSGRTPLPVYGEKCESCSFVDICAPRAVSEAGSVRNYYASVLKS